MTILEYENFDSDSFCLVFQCCGGTGSWSYLLFSAGFIVDREISFEYVEFVMPTGSLSVHVILVVRYKSLNLSFLGKRSEL